MAIGEDIKSYNSEVLALPASCAQKRVWDFARKYPDSPVLNVGVRGWLDGHLDVEKLIQAANAVAMRHETLRTRFADVNGSLRQIIESTSKLRFEVLDLAQIPATDLDATVERLSSEETRRPFALGEAGLLRIVLLRVTNTKAMLLLTSHQSVADGWSMGLICSDLARFYAELVSGSPTAAPLELQYGDFAIWQDSWLKSEDALAQLVFWRRTLSGGSATTFPRTVLPSPVDQTDADLLSTLLPKALTDAVRDLANRQGTTLFVIGLSTLAIVIARRLGVHDISIGTQISSRDQVEFESAVGPFANHVILRLNCTPDQNVTQLISSTKTVVLDALAHQSMPFEAVLRGCGGFTASEPDSPFAINFLCQRGFIKPLDFAAVSFTPVPSKSQGATFPINVFMVERAEGWRLNCEYRKADYDASFAQCLLQEYTDTLREVVERHHEPVSNLIGAPVSVAEASRDTAALTRRVQHVPASICQKRFWMLSQMLEGVIFNLPGVLRITGDLNLQFLHESLQGIVDRHEALRTSFSEIDGQLMQVVSPDAKVTLEARDLRADNVTEVELSQLVATEAQRTFDLASAPLFRCVLFRLSDQEYVLSFTLSHMIADGWSAGVIQRELRRLYDALQKGSDPNLPEVETQYGDAAAWEAQWLESDAVREQVDFWMEKLKGDLPVLDVPTDWPTVPRRQPVPAKVNIQLSPDIVKRAKQLCMTTDSTMFVVLLATYKALLFRYSGAEDILVGSTLANRNLHTEQSIGPFSNPICLRSAVSGDLSFRDLIAAVKDTTLQAFDHKDLPFELIMDRVSAKPKRNRRPLFQFYFLYQSSFVQSFDLGQVQFSVMPSPGVTASSELHLAVIERNSDLFAQLEFNGALYSETSARHILAHYERLLRSALENPDQRIAELRALSSEDLRDSGTRHPLVSALLGERCPAEPEVEMDAPPYVEPIDDIEARLRDLWEKRFGTSPLSMSAHFFDLGGSSLMAAQLCADIERGFGTRIPVNTLITSPTIKELTTRLKAAESIKAYSLVPIQPSGGKPPIFWIPGGTGVSVIAFREVALLLGNDQPSYGLQQVLDEGLVRESVQERARRALELIRELQPHGPYCIAGFCYGGLIAYEAAQQLQATGEQVSLLTLINCYFPKEHNAVDALRIKLQRSAFHVSAASKLPVTSAMSFLIRKIRNKVTPSGRTNGTQRSASPDTFAERRAFIETKNSDVMHGYTPAPYSGKMLLLVSTISDYSGVSPELDPRLSWRMLSSQVESHLLEGEHTTVLEPPSVQKMAQILLTHL